MGDVITKSQAVIQPGVDDAESENGTFDIILSAQTRDRDGDVFKADEWKQPLPQWIPIDVDHGMSVEKTVGSGHPFLNANGDLQVQGSYASTPLAQQVRTLVNEGHCRFVSVAVMTDKSLKDGVPNRELLGGAFVNTPSNREAVILSSKGFDVKAKSDDDGPSKPYGDVDYADPGYLTPDGEQAKTPSEGQCRYPLNTAQRVRTGWGYIHHEDIAAQYTPAQLTHIENALRKAGARFDIHFADDDEKKSLLAAVESIVDSRLDAVLKSGARNWALDQKRVQTIHDTANALGAQCVSEPGPDEGDGSSEGANKSVRRVLVVGKALNGSVEDLQCRLQCALNDATGAGEWSGAYAFIVATFLNPDGEGGSVVYELGGETLCRAFADDGREVTLDSNIQAVTVATSVAAIPDTVDGDPTPLPPAAEAAKSMDLDQFKAALNLLTKTSGHQPGSPDSPVAGADSADSKAAPPEGPADDESADDDTETAEDEADEDAERKKATRLLMTRIRAANARSQALPA